MSAFTLGDDELNVRDDELASSEVAAFVEAGLRKKSTEPEHVRAGRVSCKWTRTPNPCHSLVGDSKMLEVPTQCRQVTAVETPSQPIIMPIINIFRGGGFQS